MAAPSVADESSSDASRYPIRTVSALTGVSVLTLRAWERRYGLVTPMRTDGGHRVYTRADIDTIFRVLALVDSGVAIGQVKQVMDKSSAAQSPQHGEGPWAAYRARMVAAIAQFDEYLLDDVYNEMLSLYPNERVTNLALLPLIVFLSRL